MSSPGASVILTRGENGWIVQAATQDDDGQYVFEDKETTGGLDESSPDSPEADSLASALWKMLDVLGIDTAGGFGKKRVYIDVRPGDEVSATLEVKGGDDGPVTVIGHVVSVDDVGRALEKAGFGVIVPA